MKKSDKVSRKFVEQFDVSEWEVESHDGWRDISKSNKTIKYEVYEVVLENGLTIKCADTHVLITDTYDEIYAYESINEIIFTKQGPSKVVSVTNMGYSENMYDLSVGGDNLYYTNDILSHNTVTVSTYLLWVSIFHDGAINIGIVANKGPTAREVLDKIKKIFQELPLWMMKGIESWNKGSIEYDTSTRIMTDSPSSDSFRGYTINILYEDESAYIAGNLYEEYVDSVYPTMQSLIFKQVINSSTPKGMNHFFHLVEGAKNRNSDAPVETVMRGDDELDVGGYHIKYTVEEMYNQMHPEEIS